MKIMSFKTVSRRKFISEEFKGSMPTIEEIELEFS